MEIETEDSSGQKLGSSRIYTSNISAKVRGDANVSWTETDTETDSDGKSRTVYTTYSAHENYLTTKLYLVGGPSQELTLPPGEHVHNFSVILPENLPSSFEGEHGNIRYMVRAKMNRIWAFDDTVKAFFTVLSHIDLNKDPLVKEPVTNVAEKTLCCCCCRSGPLTLVGNIPAAGFVSGQEIPVTVEVDNGTNETINTVTCSLKKNVCFTSHSPSTRTKETSDKVETITFEPVGVNDSKTWTKQLKIPSLPPSALKTCGIIDIEYCLDLLLHMKSVCMEQETCMLEIIRATLKRDTILLQDTPHTTCILQMPTDCEKLVLVLLNLSYMTVWLHIFNILVLNLFVPI